jgi:hypothetical protein
VAAVAASYAQIETEARVSDRLTKQGVRDLNPVGYNGHRHTQCRHHFSIRIVIGTRWTSDQDSDYEAYEQPVYGYRCAWCTAVREEIV